MQFPNDYPMAPPFVRVTKPRFKFLTGIVMFFLSLNNLFYPLFNVFKSDLIFWGGRVGELITLSVFLVSRFGKAIPMFKVLMTPANAELLHL